MKVCEHCGDEIDTRDGDNRCDECLKASAGKKKLLRANKKAHEEALKSLGLVKVRGALGGTYWE